MSRPISCCSARARRYRSSTDTAEPRSPDSRRETDPVATRARSQSSFWLIPACSRNQRKRRPMWRARTSGLGTVTMPVDSVAVVASGVNGGERSGRQQRRGRRRDLKTKDYRRGICLRLASRTAPAGSSEDGPLFRRGTVSLELMAYGIISRQGRRCACAFHARAHDRHGR